VHYVSWIRPTTRFVVVINKPGGKLCYDGDVYLKKSTSGHILLLSLTAFQLSLGGSSLYTSTDKTDKNKYTEKTLQRQYKNTKHSKYKYTYYQNTHILQNAHIHKPTHYKTCLKQPQYKLDPIVCGD